MWQRFTERARRVIFFAQEEAGRLGENYVSTEHILLGLIREDDTIAAKVLDKMGVSLSKIKKEVMKNVTKGDGRDGQDMQLTPRAKRVIDLSYDEARSLQNNNIGTEHILLGIICEGDGLAANVLKKLGVDLDTTRKYVLELQTGKEQDENAHVRTSFTSELHNLGLSGKDVLEIACLSKSEIEGIFQTTEKLKSKSVSPEQQRTILAGKTLAMIFEKQSLRTRVSFETGIFQLGGQGIYLQPSDISLGKRESIADVAHNLERMVDIIMARTFAHETVTELAKHAKIPVINGLSDLEHPCQALADFYTILEHKGQLQGLKLAFIGDGNNVAHSLMLLAAKVGTNFTIGCPKGYEPSADVVKQAKAFAKETGAEIVIEYDPIKAVDGADAVYTDVWASMGQESEQEERAKAFASYQVNSELMKHAKDDAIFMHCLPAHRGMEVTAEVIDGPHSVVFDEAENRLHAQKAVMVLVAG